MEIQELSVISILVNVRLASEDSMFDIYDLPSESDEISQDLKPHLTPS